RTLTLNRCTFYGILSPNIAGGGRGSDTSQATISGGPGGNGEGGAVFNAAAAVLTLNNCTFVGNQALGGNGGNAPVRNGGNGGAGRGATICNFGTMTVNSTTIRANRGTGGTGGTGSHGGTGASGVGIGGLASAGGSTTVGNTICAG